jgi:hypothetical protein
MGNLKKRTTASPGICMDNDACKQTKLVYCYNMRKIKTTKKVDNFWDRTPPPNGFHGHYMHGKESLKEDSKAAQLLGYGGTTIQNNC